MRVYSSLDEVGLPPGGGRVVAFGVFDGVHRGHQLILARTLSHAREKDCAATVVTFDPHPESVVRPGSSPGLLTTLARKAALIADLGLDELIVIRFDEEFSRLTPEAFCRRVLSARLSVVAVCVGENFRFGYRGEGTAAQLAAYGAEQGFEVHAVELASVGGATVSSTRIRELVREGRVKEAAELLGRPHRLEGTVVPGNRRGRTLHAPSANLQVDEGLVLPRTGVYVTYASTGEDSGRPSVTSVGCNPTFGGGEMLQVETLLLDFDGDLYGQRLAVDFLERLREQRVFPDAASLARQIQEDVEAARLVHAQLRGSSVPSRGS